MTTATDAIQIHELNRLICDHLRHYNLRVAARVVEEEINQTQFPTQDPSLLYKRFAQLPREMSKRHVSPFPRIGTERTLSPLVQRHVSKQIIGNKSSGNLLPLEPSDPSFARNVQTGKHFLKHEALTYLQLNTEFTRAQISNFKTAYLEHYPDLMITKDSMSLILKQCYGITSQIFADRFFDALKNRDTESVQFKELIIGFNLLNEGHPQEFMRFVFRLLSSNGTDTANYSTVDRFLKSIMKGPLLKTSRMCLTALKNAMGHAQRAANAPEKTTISFDEFCQFSYETSEPTGEKPYRSFKLQVICEMLDLIQGLTIDYFIERWRQVDITSSKSYFRSSLLGENEFYIVMQQFLNIRNIETRLRTAYSIFKNKTANVDIVDFLSLVAMASMGAPQKKLQAIFMLRNDLFGVPVLTKLKLAKYFRTLGMHADYIVNKLSTQEGENVKYNELTTPDNYTPCNELLSLLNDTNKY